MLSRWKCFFTHGFAKKVKATGAGSASPVVSKMMLSYGCPDVEDRRLSSDSAVRMSLRREQQMHPFDIVTRSSLERNWLETADVHTLLHQAEPTSFPPDLRYGQLSTRSRVCTHEHTRAASVQQMHSKSRIPVSRSSKTFLPDVGHYDMTLSTDMEKQNHDTTHAALSYCKLEVVLI